LYSRIYRLYKGTVGKSDYIASNYRMAVTNGMKGCRRKRPWPIFGKYSPGVCLEGLRKNTKILSHGSYCPGRDFNLAPPEYKYEDLIQPIFSASSQYFRMSQNRRLQSAEHGIGEGKRERIQDFDGETASKRPTRKAWNYVRRQH
jgi:hypothetical protein